MKVDARLDVTLPYHPKTKRLIRRLGAAGAWSLIKLIAWTAQNRSDGDLSGMSDEDIELAVDWEGAEGALVSTLAEVGFLDGAACARSLHDWAEHQPYANGAKARSLKAQWCAMKRHHGAAEADRLVPEWVAMRAADSSSFDAESTATSMLLALPNDADRNAPSPSPSPLPSPLPNQSGPVRAKRKRPVSDLPDGFAISAEVQEWANEKGYDRLDERLEHFVGSVKANGKQYADWDQAFQNAIRGDWAKLNGSYGFGGRPLPKAPATPDKSLAGFGL